MRSVELFAGCGGLALGLSRAGCKPVLVVENDQQTVETLRQNGARRIAHIVDWPLRADDVRDIDFAQFGRVSVVSGGPPCQPFSIGGKHLGPRDPRNMWPEAVRAVRELRPKGFLFENVRGLLRPAFTDYLDYVTKQLEYPDLKCRRDEKWTEHLARLRQHAASKRSSAPLYRVVARAINAADYGAPQKRHRTIIMGVSTAHGEEWTFPKPTHSQAALVWAKHVSRDYWDQHEVRRIAAPSSEAEAQLLVRLRQREKKPRGRAWRTVRDALADLPPPSKRNEPLQGHWQHPGARVYRNHTGSDWDEPAKALKAGDHGVPGGENIICDRRGNPRYFTIREMARLQCFPDSYFVSGSWKAATRQLGNAVPTIIGEYLGRKLLAIIG
jgi:DNA (cytosine-5)-methyltransferase 1